MLPAYLFRGWKSASGSLYWRFFLVGVDLPLRVSRRLFFLQDLITITVALVTFGQHNLTSVTQLMRSVFISGQLSHASCPPLKDKTRNFNHRISKIYKSNLYHFWRKNSDQDISEDFLIMQHCELFKFSRRKLCQKWASKFSPFFAQNFKSRHFRRFFDIVIVNLNFGPILLLFGAKIQIQNEKGLFGLPKTL